MTNLSDQDLDRLVEELRERAARPILLPDRGAIHEGGRVMATRYTYATTLAYSTGDVPETDEVDVEVSFTVAWGSPGTGRPYYGPPENYDEGSPDEVEDLKLHSVDGVGGPFDQHDEAAILQAIAQNHTEAMLEAAGEREAYWADDAADHRREASR